MQNSRRVSLNAVRVFESAARHRSLKDAGIELGVTAGAISHQVRVLEEVLGLLLFERKNNAVVPTEAGMKFLDDVGPAISSIDKAINKLASNARDLTLRVSISIAVRWLIPKLEKYKNRYPDNRIRLETTHYTEINLNSGADVAITYCTRDSTLPNARFLIDDYCQPLVSPALLGKAIYQKPEDFGNIRALSSTSDNWDWQLWCAQHDLPADELDIVDQFDTDDAAIHAAVAGMGMVLMSPMMAKKEIDAGSLVVLPLVGAVKLGSYWFISSPGRGVVIDNFESWLLEEIST